MSTRGPGRKNRPAADRFWEKVEKTDSCWLWTASKNNRGYGTFAEASYKTVGAHVWAFRAIVGEIPENLELDHLCKVRNCVNPAHLELVTHGENLVRGDTVNRKRK